MVILIEKIKGYHMIVILSCVLMLFLSGTGEKAWDTHLGIVPWLSVLCVSTG